MFTSLPINKPEEKRSYRYDLIKRGTQFITARGSFFLYLFVCSLDCLFVYLLLKPVQGNP